MLKFTWHAYLYIYLDGILFISFSNIYCCMVYLYGSSIFIWKYFSVFLGMMNGGRLLAPQAPGFYPSDLPFAPSPDRAVPRFLDSSIV
jgi:hypothetical protein